MFLLAAILSAGGWLPAYAVTLSEAAGEYVIAPGSTIAFSVGQIGGGGIAGSFGRFEGSFRIDGSDAGRSEVRIVLYPQSVTTGEPRIDNFLRSSAVFDVASHREIVFQSTAVTRTGESTAHLEGMLTARGISRPASFDVTLAGGEAGRLAFDVKGEVLRSPYGMDVGTPIYSNVVQFEMRLVGSRQ
jgi:polyisoprenoid-binding protein YceI